MSDALKRKDGRIKVSEEMVERFIAAYVLDTNRYDVRIALEAALNG